VPIDRCRATW